MARHEDILVQVTDYLFDKGFTVSKPMMSAIARWVAERDGAIYEQGRISMERDLEKTNDKDS